MLANNSFLHNHQIISKLSEGDILNFVFKGSSLSLIIPVVQKNRSTTDFISTVSDFRTVGYDDWDELDEGRFSYTLVNQSWKYEDPNTKDDLAHAFLAVDVLKHNQHDITAKVLLDSKLFHEFFIAQIREDFGLSSEQFSTKVLHDFDVEGLLAYLPLGPEEGVLTPVAFFSLGSEFSLRLIFKFGVMNYPERENPLSTQELANLHAALLDELVSCINIEYNADILAKLS